MLPSRTLAKLPGLLIRASGAPVALLHQGAGSTIDHFLRGPLEALGARILEIDTAAPPSPCQRDALRDCEIGRAHV